MHARQDIAVIRAYSRPSGLPCFLIASWLLLALNAHPVSADERERDPATADGDRAEVLEKFEVAKNGGILLVPVRFRDGATHNFIIDTGSTGTTVDPALQKHLVPQERSARVAGGGRQELFSLDDAWVGRLPLRGGLCARADLAEIRERSGYEIRGILGMAFLRDYVVQIDFDAGRITFRKHSDGHVGTKVRLAYELGCPLVRARLGSRFVGEFVIDTGFQSCCVCGICRADFARLLARGDLAPRPETDVVDTPFGARACRIARAAKLELGGFSHDPAFVQEADDNQIGLAWLSRYRVTFDFPNSVMFLDKGARFDEAPVYDLSGLTLRRKNGAMVVGAVRQGSAAAIAGIEVGDRLVQVDDRAANEFSTHELEQALCERGRTFRILIERQGATRECRVRPDAALEEGQQSRSAERP